MCNIQTSNTIIKLLYNQKRTTYTSKQNNHNVINK